MNKCNDNNNVSSILIFNAEDIKSIDENGLVMKRKYGSRLREVYGFNLEDINKNMNESVSINSLKIQGK